MKSSKHFKLFLAFLLVFSTFSLTGVTITQASQLENAVTIKVIDENGEDIIPLSAIEIEEGDVAIDVLTRVAEIEKVELELEEHPDYGTMIISIGNVSEENDHYWSFIVNGLAAEVGASEYEVDHGDNILISLTDEWEPSVKVTVSAINKNETIIEDIEVIIMEGASGYDALFQAALQNKLALDTSIDDTYFTFLDNLGETELDETDFWNISVNDEDLMLGILEYDAVLGDRIKLEVQSFDMSDETEDAESSNETVDNNLENLLDITDETVEKNIQEITDYFNEKNIELKYGNEWWLWGLVNANEKIPANYLATTKEEINKVDGEFKNVIDLEKIIIALSLIGEDATKVDELDLIELLVNHTQLENPTINAAIYALLAFDSKDYNVEKSEKDNLINLILDLELEQGGWSFTGDEPNIDITSMVLSALSPYHDEQDVQEAVNRAVDYLSNNQAENGGYYEELNGGYTSESVSLVIIGLTSVGVDPTSNEFTKNGVNLVQHLMAYKNKDLGYSHKLEEEESSDIATPQALLAFTAFEKHINLLGSVYKYDEKNTVSVEDQNEKDDSSSRQTIYFAIIALLIIVIGGASLIFYNRSKKKGKY